MTTCPTCKQPIKKGKKILIDCDAPPHVPDGCWLWYAALDKNGYGAFSIGVKNGKKWKTKNLRPMRMIYELFNGKIPDKLVLDHLCQNKSCVNPKHLEPVTNAENIRRGKGTKLSAVKIARIRALAATGMPQTKIANLFLVHKTTIGLILNGKNWKSA